MLKKETKQNNIKFSVKTKKAEKRVEDKNKNKEQGNRQKRVTNKVDTNSTIQ